MHILWPPFSQPCHAMFSLVIWRANPTHILLEKCLIVFLGVFQLQPLVYDCKIWNSKSQICRVWSYMMTLVQISFELNLPFLPCVADFSNTAFQEYVLWWFLSNCFLKYDKWHCSTQTMNQRGGLLQTILLDIHQTLPAQKRGKPYKWGIRDQTIKKMTPLSLTWSEYSDNVVKCRSCEALLEQNF